MKHMMKKQRTPRGFFFSFFSSCLPFLLSSLETKRGKERNGDEFFLLDRKKRENILEEGPTIYKYQQSTAQHIKELQGSEKALFVTLIIRFDFSLNVT